MEKGTVDDAPLLSPRVDDEAAGYARKTSSLVSATKWTIRSVICLVFIAWAGFIFFFPTELSTELFYEWIDYTKETHLGITGSFFLLLSAPVLIIAFLAIAYLLLSGEEKLPEKKGSKHPSFRLWTFPVLVNGPFGVVSATEFIGIVLFTVYVVWALYNYTLRALGSIPDDYSSFKDKSQFMVEKLGVRFGTTGMMCLAFLFIPISRGSVLLRYIDIPFEHATRYHVWLGHLTMVLFTLHGLLSAIAWAMDGSLVEKLLEWKDMSVSNFPGVISLVSGLLMWVTSLPGVRTWKFELFYYTHQLYVVFVVFLALHVGDFMFNMAAGGIFLFMLDRFLRFCQSRRTVNVVSSRCLPCGTVELVLSKPQNLRYNALSFIFLQVREVSWLQWHPFSVSSSPLDGNHHLSVLIKGLGKWTSRLRQRITDVDALKDDSSVKPHTMITASVEGPYGHKIPYHLKYENLILVAGGIGLSPFLAILSDILHRVREGKHCQPRNILVAWAVKKSNELPLLSTIDMETICPSFSDKVNIDIHIYVTRESDPPLEEGHVYKQIKSSFCPVASDCGVSVLVGTGNRFWSGLYVMSSTIGLVILVALLNIYYIEPYGVFKWWYKGLLFVICMVASVVIFGGLVVVVWHIWENRSSMREKSNNIEADKAEQNDDVAPKNPSQYNVAKSNVTRYGSRPDFKEIFEMMSKKWGHVDVGVLVCGPPTLETSIAQEIRSHSMTRQHHHPIFHFHSHSFGF